MKRRIILAPALFGVALLTAVPSPGREAERWEAFDGGRALKDVRVLVQDFGPRPTGSLAERRARAWVRRRFEEAGVEVREQPVDRVVRPGPKEGERRWFQVGSANLVARIPGTDPAAGRVLLAGHLDSRDLECPGANDDASAVAVLLEVARVLRDDPLPAEAILLVTAAEEVGMLGATAYVDQASLDGLRFALTLDPVGHGSLFVSPFPDPPPLWAVRSLRRAASRAGVSRVAADPAYNLVSRISPLRFGADHIPFLQAGVPAFNLSNRLERWSYHTAHDTFERVEEETLEAAGRLSLALLEEASRRPLRTAEDSAWIPLPVPGLGPGPGWVHLLSPFLWSVCLAGAAAGISGLVLPAGHGSSRWRLLPPLAAWLLIAAGALVPEAILGWVFGSLVPWWSAPGRHLLALGLAVLVLASALRALRWWWGHPPPAACHRTQVGAAAGLLALAGLLLLVQGPDLGFLFLWPALLWGLWARWPSAPRPALLRFLLHLLLGLAALWPLAATLRPAVVRQTVEFLRLRGSLDPASGLLFLVPLLLALGGLGLYGAALPRGHLWRPGWRTPVLGALVLAWFVAALAWVPPYSEGRRQTVVMEQDLGDGSSPAQAVLHSHDLLPALRTQRGLLLPQGRRHRLTAPARAPLDLEMAAVPLEPGSVRLRLRMASEVPARFLVLRLEGEALSSPELPGAGGDRLWILAAGQKRRLVWEGEVRAPPGSEIRVVAEARWDADLLGLEPRAPAVALDAVARAALQPRSLTLPADSALKDGGTPQEPARRKSP